MRPQKWSRFSTIAYTIAALIFLLGLLPACTLSPRNFHAAENIVSTTAAPPIPLASSTSLVEFTITPFPSPQPSSTPALTSTALAPTLTATPIPSFTPSPILANPAAEGWVIGEGVNLRAGPSQLFPVLKVLPYHTEVGVLSASPGRQWLEVRTGDEITGWMMAHYIQTSLAVEAISQAPAAQDWIMLKGSVKDSAGRPLVGADVLLYDSQGNRAITRSWEDSYFYLLLPKNSQGSWTLRVLRPVCRGPAQNPQCPGPGYFIDNPRVLEIFEDQLVELVYQLY